MSTGHLRIAGGLCAVALAFGAAACGSGGSSSATSSTAGGKPASGGKPLTVGISLSLSGDFSDPGNAALRGYRLWAQTVNAKGGILGRKVTLKIVDDTSSPNQVVTNYQTLINRDHVDLTFGPFSTLLTAPAAAVANRYGYAFPEPAGGGPAVFKEKLGNVFFVQPAVIATSEAPIVIKTKRDLILVPLSINDKSNYQSKNTVDPVFWSINSSGRSVQG